MSETTGLKTKFQREGDTPDTFEDVAKVAGISPPQLSRDVAEVDELDPPDEIKGKLPGAIDAGEVSLTLNFDPDNDGHTALESDFWAGAARKYRIKLPNGYGWTFSGFVSGYAPSEIVAGDVVQAEVTITVTSKPTTGPISS